MVAPGGVHGCSRGACVVAPRGVCMVAPGGACVVAPGGVHGCSRGACVVAPRGVCMVAPGGGMRGCSGVHGFLGGVHGFFGGCMHGFFDEIRSMSGRYASYWNAFLLDIISNLKGYYITQKYLNKSTSFSQQFIF